MGRRKIEIKAIKDDRNRSVYVFPFATHKPKFPIAVAVLPYTTEHFHTLPYWKFKTLSKQEPSR